MSAGVLPSAAHIPLMRQQRQTFMQRCTFNFLSQTGDNFDVALDVTRKTWHGYLPTKPGSHSWAVQSKRISSFSLLQRKLQLSLLIEVLVISSSWIWRYVLSKWLIVISVQRFFLILYLAYILLFVIGHVLILKKCWLYSFKCSRNMSH